MLLQLQPRLMKLADLVSPGAHLADIGTDHGYLPVYLLQNRRIAAAIAADIGSEPLEHARRTAAQFGVEAIDFRLCDGLCGIAPDEADTVVIAGMGGETIISILSNAPWLADGKHTLLLQPMTKTELLRQWLPVNGYAFTNECLVWDKEYLYPIFVVKGGFMPPLTAAQMYGGVLLEGDPLYAAYLQQRIEKLQHAIRGLKQAKDCCSYGKACELQEICDALIQRRDAL